MRRAKKKLQEAGATYSQWKNMQQYISKISFYFYFYVLMSWGPTGGQQTEFTT